MKTISTVDPRQIEAFDKLPPVEEGEPRLRVERVSPKGVKSYTLGYAEQYTDRVGQ